MGRKKKVVIITGGGHGIGKNFAYGLAAEGARVVLAEADYGACQEVAAKIMEGGGEALALHTDVTSEESVKEMANKVIQTYGAIDVLVNNAAIFSTLKMKPLEDIEVDEWDRAMSVNLRGMFLAVKAVIPQMKKQNSGKIINISSTTVFSGAPYFIHYVTSKAGIIGFTRAAAKELGPFGIAVNVITPGLTETDETKNVIPKERFKTVKDLRAFKRSQKPEDILGPLSFLISEKSNFITGQIINVDGGHCFP